MMRLLRIKICFKHSVSRLRISPVLTRRLPRHVVNSRSSLGEPQCVPPKFNPLGLSLGTILFIVFMSSNSWLVQVLIA